MLFGTDADTDADGDIDGLETELVEAVEWLCGRGYLRRRPSPLEALLDE
jgi:hypothetical protein